MADSQQQSRGRSIISKPLYAHGKLKSAPARGEGNSKRVAVERTQSTMSAAASTKTVIRSNSSAKISGQTPSQETSDNFKVTKLSSTTVKLSSTSWTPPPPPAKVPPPAPQRQGPSPATDSLHLAAQVYSWKYMSSTLDACFNLAEESATNDLNAKKEEIAAEEAEVSELRERLDAQRAIDFYDELGSELFVKEAPAIMQQFHSHGNLCTQKQTEALKLATSGEPSAEEEEPLQPYHQMLDDLEELQKEAESLQNSITKLTVQASATSDKNDDGNACTSDNAEVNTARQQIIGVFAACLPVLKARIANLSITLDLVDSALENASLSLRMESMGIMD